MKISDVMQDLADGVLTKPLRVRFRNSKGWTVGADASVTLVRAGVDASVDTQTGRRPVIAYVLAKTGLLVDVSLEGAKFARMDL